MKKLFVVLLMVLLMGCLVQGVFAKPIILPENPGWSVQHYEDIVTGKSMPVLMNVADRYSGTSTSPVLGIRKTRDGAELFVIWFIMMDESVLGVAAFIGDPDLNEREVLSGTIANGGMGLFFDNSQALIDRMLLEERLALIGFPHTGGNVVGVWDISGLKDVIHLIK